jgi:hypothetical protein
MHPPPKEDCSPDNRELPLDPRIGRDARLWPRPLNRPAFVSARLRRGRHPPWLRLAKKGHRDRQPDRRQRDLISSYCDGRSRGSDRRPIRREQWHSTDRSRCLAAVARPVALLGTGGGRSLGGLSCFHDSTGPAERFANGRSPSPCICASTSPGGVGAIEGDGVVDANRRGRNRGETLRFREARASVDAAPMFNIGVRCGAARIGVARARVVGGGA